jgi:hypothetical protein
MLHLPDNNANKSVSGSGELVSFETKTMGGADGSATDGVAEKIMAPTKIQKRIVFWPGIAGSSGFSDLIQ